MHPHREPLSILTDLVGRSQPVGTAYPRLGKGPRRRNVAVRIRKQTAQLIPLLPEPAEKRVRLIIWFVTRTVFQGLVPRLLCRFAVLLDVSLVLGQL